MSAPGWRLPEVAVGTTPTYRAHALALAALHGPGPWPNGGAPLPDARPPAERPFICDAVFDGVRTHHMPPGDHDAGPCRDLAGRVQALALGQPTPQALVGLHEAAAAVSPLSIAEALLREVRQRDLPTGHLRQIGLWLAEHGTRRAAVAVGIILLGLAADVRDRGLLLLLGTLEDLTLYAAVALHMSQVDRDQAIFELARRVDGWGRIHTVNRLAGTADPEIKAWLLREGFRNTILDEYLAYTAATTGDLAAALAQDHIDEALLDGAGGILLALCRGGPARDMTDYPDAPVAIQRYVVQAGRWRPTLGRIAIVATLHRFITSPRARRLPCSAEQLTGLAAGCSALTGRAAWRAVLEQALASDDIEQFGRAIWPATTLGVRIGHRLRHHLRRNPYDAALWFPLIDDPDEADQAIQLAAQVLPLADLATGPGLELGRWRGPEHILDLVVSRLAGHPGRGWPLIHAALSNATIRNRNMALNALEAWPADAVPHQAYAAVREAIRIEPDNEIRDRMRRFLNARAT